MMLRRRSLPRAGSALMLALAFMTARLAPGSDMSTCFTHGNAMPMMHVMADGTHMQDGASMQDDASMQDGASMQDDAPTHAPDAAPQHDGAPAHNHASCCNCCVVHHAVTGIAVAFVYAQLAQHNVPPAFAATPLYLPRNVAYIQPFSTAPPVTL